jgi:hypothetical protein
MEVQNNTPLISQGNNATMDNVTINISNCQTAVVIPDIVQFLDYICDFNTSVEYVQMKQYPYTIEEKLEYNNIYGSYNSNVVETFELYSNSIETAIYHLQEKNIKIDFDLKHTFRNLYQKVLLENENSTEVEIFESIVHKLAKSWEPKVPSKDYETILSYSFMVSTVFFYKCSFLKECNVINPR